MGESRTEIREMGSEMKDSELGVVESKRVKG